MAIDPKARDTDHKYKYLETKRRYFEPLWQDIADYIVPHRSDIQKRAQDGVRQDLKIYNTKGVQANNIWSAGIYGSTISQALNWFKLRMGKQIFNTIPEVKRWLQEVEEQMYFAFARSNFYPEMHMFIEDGGSIGTAAVSLEEDIARGLVVFNTAPIGECYIEENYFGEVDVLCRERMRTARQLVEQFGDAKLPPKVMKAYRDNPYQEFAVIHLVQPRKDNERDSTKIDAKNKKYSSIWKLKGENTILLESGFDSFPYSVWRYRKSGKEIYGRSPASSALAEIVSLNLISKDLLAASELAIFPPMNVPAKQTNYDLMPHGVNFYSDPQSVISPINQGINYPIGLDREQKIEKIIDDHYNIAFFTMLINNEKQMTATEIIEKKGEQAILTSPIIGRFNSEALDSIIDKVFEIEFKAGRLPTPPQILLDHGGEIDVVYMGPLAQAQRRLFQTQGISRGLEMILPIAQFRPEILDMYDWDKVVLELGDANGMPEKVKNDPQIVLQIRSARQAAEQQVQQQMQMTEGAKAMRDIGAGAGAMPEGMAEALQQQAGVGV